jgi:hypothetical protein
LVHIFLSTAGQLSVLQPLFLDWREAYGLKRRETNGTRHQTVRTHPRGPHTSATLSTFDCPNGASGIADAVPMEKCCATKSDQCNKSKFDFHPSSSTLTQIV